MTNQESRERKPSGIPAERVAKILELYSHDSVAAFHLKYELDVSPIIAANEAREEKRHSKIHNRVK